MFLRHTPIGRRLSVYIRSCVHCSLSMPRGMLKDSGVAVGVVFFGRQKVEVKCVV